MSNSQVNDSLGFITPVKQQEFSQFQVSTAKNVKAYKRAL